MKYLLVLLIIILGSIVAQFIPENFHYIYGFFIGGIVQAILNF